MWIRGEQAAAVFALLMTMAWTELICDLAKMETLDASLLRGTMYPVLANDPRFVGSSAENIGYDFKPIEKNDGLYVAATVYYTFSFSSECFQNRVECQVADNGCKFGTDYSYYIVAYDCNYTVMFVTNGSEPGIVVIFVRDFQEREQIQDLPRRLLDKIKDRCGKKSIKSSFYTQKFNPGNFIPGCE